MIPRSPLALTLALLILTGCSSPYNDILIPPMREVEAMTELIDQEVDLTADQRIKVREIVVDNAGMHTRIQQQYAGRMLELKDQEKNRLKKFNRQLEGIFTAEQVTAWEPLYRAIYNNEMEGYHSSEGFQQNRQHDDFGRGQGY